ncbi:hypothetical protein RhiirC2_721097, partial [Rhizophagus irregularis]
PTRKVLKETQKISNATTDNSRRKVSEADKIALKLGSNSKDTSYYHLMEGLKNRLTQNKEIFQVIYDVKNEQKEFYKKTREQLNELLEKVDQLMIPENSYWKGNLLYIQAIKNKAWGKKKTSEKDTAFTLAVCETVLNLKHPKISIGDNSLRNRYNIYLDCLSNSKEITANTTKQIRLMEICKENDSDTSSNNSGDSESNYDQELEDNQELGIIKN